MEKDGEEYDNLINKMIKENLKKREKLIAEYEIINENKKLKKENEELKLKLKKIKDLLL